MDPSREDEQNLRRRPMEDSSTNNERSLFSPPTTTMYQSANDYAMAVRAWLWAYQSWHLTQYMMPFYMQRLLLQNGQLSIAGNATSTTGTAAPTAQTVPSPFITAESARGNRYVIPAFGRRLLAEGIDFVLCFIFSLFITYICVEVGIIELGRYEKLLSDEADLKTLIDVTQELFPIEVVKKILTSIIEALFTAYGSSVVPPGSTPGKFLMGLKVIRCESAQVVATRDYRVIVHYDTERVTFARALVRSLIKQFALGFLFPLCITMYVWHFNRALYDVVAGTIVVEA